MTDSRLINQLFSSLSRYFETIYSTVFFNIGNLLRIFGVVIQFSRNQSSTGQLRAVVRRSLPYDMLCIFLMSELRRNVVKTPMDPFSILFRLTDCRHEVACIPCRPM